MNKPCKICNLNPRYRKNSSYCKECQASFIKAWRENNVEYIREKKSEMWKNTSKDKRYDIHLRQRYGISNDDYTVMLREQNGVCKICYGESFRLRLSVDHCHKTGKVRGLLCERCNTLLGRVKEDIRILESAITYLKESQCLC
jgi:hypothetical protein